MLYLYIGVPLFAWAVSAIGAEFAGMISKRDGELTLHQVIGSC